MKRIGVIGCGNIAGLITDFSLEGDIIAVFDRHSDRSDQIAKKCSAKAFTDFTQFIKEPFELVIEIASIEAVRAYAEAVLQMQCDLLILSAGAFADKNLKQRLLSIAKKRSRRILIPSGALFGLDNAKIARYGEVDTLTMQTTKPPKSYSIQTDKRKCLFRGGANECIKHYPRNANAAVALGMAAQKEVQIELWADPSIVTNTHEVHISGSFGEAVLKINNKPSPHNPSTSYLAALSVVAMINTRDSTIVVGT
ncbi:MAG: aspartate dehydrogenase [Proteobacteria bacterium]|nr:aspartate dehydrogenase [Pseudomonadota bacterium]MBU1140305.1 aspartate dehydrogenase [Pseudomonadota bacterium]MBU1232970.1 aspartate dehydrogenase [Pseudomonadota bacterium]MBU1418292.1 aspartate dehydrogenase [Pseudomonadota bacterium]MBU1455408.1 aspartate dehydrogenase [Pseudomonadota bacterium]